MSVARGTTPLGPGIAEREACAGSGEAKPSRAIATARREGRVVRDMLARGARIRTSPTRVEEHDAGVRAGDCGDCPSRLRCKVDALPSPLGGVMPPQDPGLWPAERLRSRVNGLELCRHAVLVEGSA
jgi:hypothetical protein